MNKKSIVLLTSLALVASACASSKPAATTSNASTSANPASTAAAVKKAPVEIEFWHAMGGDLGNVLKQQIDTFNQSQTEVVVKPVFQQSYDVTGEKLQAAVVAGNVPDIVQLNTRVWPAFAQNGALLALDNYVKTDKDFNAADLKKGLMVNTALNGKQYTLPYNRSTPILYYNKDIMKEIGLNPEDPVHTWDELVAAAKKATVVNNGKTERFGFAASMSGWYDYSMIWSAGGNVLGTDMKTVLLDKPEAARGLQLWVDMVNKDKTMMPPVGGTSTSGTGAGQSLDQSFYSGKVAFFIGSTASLSTVMNNAKFSLGATFLPKFNEYATPTGGANLAILAKTSKEKQDAAWKFIKFMTSKEQTIYFSQKSGYLTIRESAEKSTEMQDYYKKFPLFTVALKQLDYAKEVPSLEQTKRIETEIDKAMEKAVTTNIPAEQAMKEAADKIRGYIK
ncbi:ABC transporter substrate-binding protein [Paenibacillus sp. GP183]|jgi:sn-glycerol 3-phosphate transport system substrate-binding protein|uniref:ABC transporter substrate-binding protein n=1 Tax=Paenibacillus sp. GP183 TaxID=1882751 RepID=UPI000898AD45|nr:ABC transporter substrate-binding protein [Paenibacillus sp. GP183]SEB85202.1 carbohydrate ABC transporter substrate-binding protein, CUT1 family [Paenibacillus sp. GP183]